MCFSEDPSIYYYSDVAYEETQKKRERRSRQWDGGKDNEKTTPCCWFESHIAYPEGMEEKIPIPEGFESTTLESFQRMVFEAAQCEWRRCGRGSMEHLLSFVCALGKFVWGKYGGSQHLGWWIRLLELASDPRLAAEVGFSVGESERVAQLIEHAGWGFDGIWEYPAVSEDAISGKRDPPIRFAEWMREQDREFATLVVRTSGSALNQLSQKFRKDETMSVLALDSNRSGAAYAWVCSCHVPLYLEPDDTVNPNYDLERERAHVDRSLLLRAIKKDPRNFQKDFQFGANGFPAVDDEIFWAVFNSDEQNQKEPVCSLWAWPVTEFESKERFLHVLERNPFVRFRVPDCLKEDPDVRRAMRLSLQRARIDLIKGRGLAWAFRADTFSEEERVEPEDEDADAIFRYEFY